MRHETTPRFVAILTALLLCAGPAGCARYTPAPTLPTDDAEYKPGGVSREGLVDDPPPPLVLLPGDTITARAISAESYEYQGLIVDAEGKVHVPMAGPVLVKGLNPQEAEKKIEESLQRFDRFVRVSVLVTAWGGHNATVIGAVNSEGPRPVTPDMRVAELIAAAGGLSRAGGDAATGGGGNLSYAGDLDAARLVRDGKPLPISVRRALDGEPRHNVRVHPGDQLFVPAGLGSRIAVLGHSGSGGTMLTYRPGLRLTEALATAGGISRDADDEDIRVIRGPLADPKVYVWSLEALTKEKHGDIELAPGDVVFVTEHWVASAGEVVERVAPLLTLMTAVIGVGLQVYTIRAISEN
jgi:polysaccharide export outer membrane protein